MLTVAEEIFLLMLDYDTGRLRTELPPTSVHNAIGGALLMDLSLENRIDTDLKRLFVVDRTPLGEPITDQILGLIVETGDTKSTGFWLNVLAVDGDVLQAQLIGQMIERGIVLNGKDGRLQVMGVHDAGDHEGKPMRDVRRPIERVVLSGEIPHPRDIMIISLANACALWHGLIDAAVYAKLATKIEQYAAMDLIGREVARIIRVRRA